MISVNIECKLNGNVFHPRDIVIDTRLGELYNVASFKTKIPPNLNDEVEFIVDSFSCKGFIHKITEGSKYFTIEARSYGAKLSAPYSKDINTIINGKNTTEILEKISPMIDNRLPEYVTFGGVARDGTLRSVVENIVGFMNPDIYANKDDIIIYPRRGVDGDAIVVNDCDILGDISVDIQPTSDVCGRVVVYESSTSTTSDNSDYSSDDYPNSFEDGGAYGSIDSSPPSFRVTVSDGIAKIYVDKDCVVSIDGVSEMSFDECSEDIEKMTQQVHLDVGESYISLSNNALPATYQNHEYPIRMIDDSGKSISVSRNSDIKNGVQINEAVDECTARVEYSTFVYYATPIYDERGAYRVVIKSKCGEDIVAEGIDSSYLGTSETCGIRLPYDLKVNLMTNFGITIEEARVATASFNGHLVKPDKYGVAVYQVLSVGTIEVTAYVPPEYTNAPQKQITTVIFKVQ